MDSGFHGGHLAGDIQQQQDWFDAHAEKAIPPGFTSRDDFLDACERAGVDVTEWRGVTDGNLYDNGGCVS
jgi:hypothetical protein